MNSSSWFIVLNSKSDTLPLPMLGGIGRLYVFRQLNITGRVAGMSFGGWLQGGEAEASLNFNPIDYLGISLGYRSLLLRAERGNKAIDFFLSGPYFSLLFRF